MQWTSRAGLHWRVEPVWRPMMALVTFLVLFAALLALATAASASRETAPVHPAAMQAVHTTSPAGERA